MRKERTRDEFYKEAAAFLNQGERAVAESGEGVGSTLSFLTRGKFQDSLRARGLLISRCSDSPTREPVHG